MWQPKSVNRVNMIGLYQLTSCLLVNCWAGLVLQPFLDIFKEKNHLFNHRWFSNAPWAPSRCSTKFQSSIDFVWHFQCHTGNTVQSVTVGYMDIFRNLGLPSCSNVQVLLTGLHPKAWHGAGRFSSPQRPQRWRILAFAPANVWFQDPWLRSMLGLERLVSWGTMSPMAIPNPPRS